MDPFIGEIKLFAGNFPPVGWLFCWGDPLDISKYQALYSLIGTQFGGDGVSKFALPDLRGRVPIGFGAGINLTPRNMGDNGGSERVALDATQIPSHAHTINNTATATNSLTVNGSGTIKCATSGNSSDAANSYPGKLKGTNVYNNDPTQATSTMASDAVQLSGGLQGDIKVTVDSQCQATGGGQNHENMPPFVSVNYIIAYSGIYPTRP